MGSFVDASLESEIIVAVDERLERVRIGGVTGCLWSCEWCGCVDLDLLRGAFLSATWRKSTAVLLKREVK